MPSIAYQLNLKIFLEINVIINKKIENCIKNAIFVYSFKIITKAYLLTALIIIA